jgi:hypothetical protein
LFTDVAQRRCQGKAHTQTTNEQPRTRSIHQPGASMFSQSIFGAMHATIHEFTTPGNAYGEFVTALVQAQLPAIARHLGAIE